MFLCPYIYIFFLMRIVDVESSLEDDLCESDDEPDTIIDTIAADMISMREYESESSRFTNRKTKSDDDDDDPLLEQSKYVASMQDPWRKYFAENIWSDYLSDEQIFMHDYDIKGSCWLGVNLNAMMTRRMDTSETSVKNHINSYGNICANREYPNTLYYKCKSNIFSLEKEFVSKNIIKSYPWSGKTLKIAPMMWAFYDIETLFQKGFSNAKNEHDKIIQISTIFIWKDERKHQKSTPHKHIVVVGPCDPIDDAIVTCVPTEKDLLIFWLKFIFEVLQPHVFCMYNGLSFDNPYIHDRIKYHYGKDEYLSKFIANMNHKRYQRNPVIKVDAFKKKGFNKGQSMIINIGCAINLDLIIYVSKYCFKSYPSLNVLARDTLGESKVDLKPQMINEYFKEYTPEAICRIARYCIQDSMLVFRLVDKYSCLEIVSNLATLFGVPMAMRASSSNSIIIMCMRKAFDMGHLYPHLYTYVRDYVNGGQVIVARKGQHGWVLLLDFRSLYPSLMRWMNYDPSTHLNPDVYNQIEWKLILDLLGGVKGSVNVCNVHSSDGKLQKKHYFANANIRKGVIPTATGATLDLRAEYKKCKAFFGESLKAIKVALDGLTNMMKLRKGVANYGAETDQVCDVSQLKIQINDMMDKVKGALEKNAYKNGPNGTRTPRETVMENVKDPASELVSIGECCINGIQELLNLEKSPTLSEKCQSSCNSTLEKLNNTKRKFESELKKHENNQLSCKLAGNSVYGILCQTISAMAHPQTAESITGMGRVMLIWVRRMIMSKFNKKNGCKYDAEIVYGDTDSVMVKIIPPADECPDEDSEMKFCVKQGQMMVDLINSEMDKSDPHNKGVMELELEWLMKHFTIGSKKKKYSALVYNPYNLIGKPKLKIMGWEPIVKKVTFRLAKTIMYNMIDGTINHSEPDPKKAGYKRLKGAYKTSLREYISNLFARLRRDEFGATFPKDRAYEKDVNHHQISYVDIMRSTKLNKNTEDYTSDNLPHVRLALKNISRGFLYGAKDTVRMVLVETFGTNKIADRVEDPLVALVKCKSLDGDLYVKQVKSSLKGMMSILFSEKEIRDIFNVKRAKRVRKHKKDSSASDEVHSNHGLWILKCVFGMRDDIIKSARMVPRKTKRKLDASNKSNSSENVKKKQKTIRNYFRRIKSDDDGTHATTIDNKSSDDSSTKTTPLDSHRTSKALNESNKVGNAQVSPKTSTKSVDNVREFRTETLRERTQVMGYDEITLTRKYRTGNVKYPKKVPHWGKSRLHDLEKNRNGRIPITYIPAMSAYRTDDKRPHLVSIERSMMFNMHSPVRSDDTKPISKPNVSNDKHMKEYGNVHINDAPREHKKLMSAFNSLPEDQRVQALYEIKCANTTKLKRRLAEDGLARDRYNNFEENRKLYNSQTTQYKLTDLNFSSVGCISCGTSPSRIPWNVDKVNNICGDTNANASHPLIRDTEFELFGKSFTLCGVCKSMKQSVTIYTKAELAHQAIKYGKIINKCMECVSSCVQTDDDKIRSIAECRNMHCDNLYEKVNMGMDQYRSWVQYKGVSLCNSNENLRNERIITDNDDQLKSKNEDSAYTLCDIEDVAQYLCRNRKNITSAIERYKSNSSMKMDGDSDDMDLDEKLSTSRNSISTNEQIVISKGRISRSNPKRRPIELNRKIDAYRLIKEVIRDEASTDQITKSIHLINEKDDLLLTEMVLAL